MKVSNIVYLGQAKPGSGGGGGSVDYSKTVQKTDTMPVASADNENQVFMYTGATNASYTTNYIYRNIKTSTYTSTVTFEAATLSSSTIACSGSDFAAFVAEWGSGDITTITNGTITYDQSGGLLVFVGKDADSTTVCTFQLYTQDYQDAGFTITGTLQDGDVFAFTCSISEASATYAWTRVDVQPQPTAADIGAVTQTTTTITLASTDWSSHTQTKTVSGVTADNTVIVSPVSTSAADYAAAEVYCTAQTANSLTFSCTTDPTNNLSVNIVILN